eukprot:TRINITY_DN13705_c0_g1_i1.p1 TRINITY_DN13705_c0_g1~~TRINITY_DN13705_c0_g1_i1.p1  ORF type:complete len:291 (-),score=-27.76 TRINITY_DN13705_c0_g1_i1:1249-2121(-)
MQNASISIFVFKVKNCKTCQKLNNTNYFAQFMPTQQNMLNFAYMTKTLMKQQYYFDLAYILIIQTEIKIYLHIFQVVPFQIQSHQLTKTNNSSKTKTLNQKSLLNKTYNSTISFPCIVLTIQITMFTHLFLFSHILMGVYIQMCNFICQHLQYYTFIQTNQVAINLYDFYNNINKLTCFIAQSYFGNAIMYFKIKCLDLQYFLYYRYIYKLTQYYYQRMQRQNPITMVKCNIDKFTIKCFHPEYFLVKNAIDFFENFERNPVSYKFLQILLLQNLCDIKKQIVHKIEIDL